MEDNLETTVEATDQQAPAALEQTAETEPETEVQAVEPAAEDTPAEVDTEALLPEPETPATDPDEAKKLAILEAIVYVTDEPLTVVQMAGAMGEPVESIKALLNKLVAEYERPEHGLAVREVAGGYKMATKPEHHEAVRVFVKNLNPPLKLSLAALETLAVIAYKQPLTAPEIMEIRGVQGAGVLKTLIDRKLITTAGRKNVVGKPILYKTTKEFLVQFGLKDLNELPSLKEFEELRRLAFQDADEPVLGQVEAAPAATESTPESAPEAPVEESTPSAESETPAEAETAPVESATDPSSEPRS
jgi:segregation and condensation protein B